MTKTLLKISGLKVAYGGIQAVKGIDLEVHDGELVTLIGSNGAGKTTTMKAITGLLPAAEGSIEYLGQSIKGQGSWDLVKQGLAMVPEGRGVFTRMSILENLKMGAHVRSDDAEVAKDIESMFELFPRLYERKDQLSGTMSGGEQQMLAMARALMSRPRVLLLDEPSMGLSPIMVDKIFEVVRDVSARGVTVLLVEQNAHMALQVATFAYVMENGRFVLAGTPEELKENEFKELYNTEENKPKEFIKEVQIDTDFEILFPDNYINSITERLNLYNELSTLETDEELLQYEQRLIDRFGELPFQAIDLLDSVRLKWFAKQLGLEKVVLKQKRMIGYFISNQQSEFYQTKAFTTVLKYVQQNATTCVIKEKQTKIGLRLLITFIKIDSVEVALKRLQKVLGDF